VRHELLKFWVFSPHRKGAQYPTISNKYITKMNEWINLKMRLAKNKTIDKYVQKQINREII